MAEKLRVRVYNVRFGDAILLTVPDRDPQTGKTTRRHVLIDVGNVLNKEGGEDTVFKPVVEDVIEQLDGRPLDLYVMTHEHLDHVQGLYYAATKVYPKGELKQKLKVDHAWLTASAAPDYYDRHPEAKKQKNLLIAAYERIASHLQLLPAEAAAPFSVLLANNNPRSTNECIEFLRGIAKPNNTHYVHRGFKTTRKHPFREAKFEIWAPEEDTSDYYRSLVPMALSSGDSGGPTSAAILPHPPAGVDAGAFYDLVELRGSGFTDNLLAIDKAANNTSVVFTLEWRGKRLLFAGDAELTSWRMMRDKGVLKPVDFVKVSHHGSHNGTPDAGILDIFLPTPGISASKRRAVISTWADTYGGIPHDPTNQLLRGRCKLLSTLDEPDKPYFDVEIAGS